MRADSSQLIRRLIAAALILLASFSMSAPLAESHGSFATSDFSVSWTDRWHSVGDSTTNLILSDGITYIHAVGIFETATPERSVTDLVHDWFTNVIVGENVAEIQPVTSASPVRAYSIYTYRYRVTEQRLDPYAVYFEARRISPALLLWIVIDTHLGLYRADPQVFENAVASLQLEGDVPTGPPAQSFASGPWVISIATATLEVAIPSLGLSHVAGSQWLVVLADIANMGNTENAFGIETIVVETDSGVQIPPSLIDSEIASNTLHLQGGSVDATSLMPGDQIRLALVYLLPEAIANLHLKIANQRFSIDDDIDADIGVGTLPPHSQFPLLQAGVIEGWNDDSTVRIRTADGTLRSITLLGSRIPTLTSCFGSETHAYLQTLVGMNVALEFDPAVLSSGHAYLWMDHGTATPTLLNHRLLETGMATIVAMPEHARFERWLEQSETAAKNEGDGRWIACA